MLIIAAANAYAQLWYHQGLVFCAPGMHAANLQNIDGWTVCCNALRLTASWWRMHSTMSNDSIVPDYMHVWHVYICIYILTHPDTSMPLSNGMLPRWVGFHIHVPRMHWCAEPSDRLDRGGDMTQYALKQGCHRLRSASRRPYLQPCMDYQWCCIKSRTISHACTTCGQHHWLQSCACVVGALLHMTTQCIASSIT